jgi:hypothetical protein
VVLAALLFVAVVAAAGLLVARGQTLKDRAALIHVGEFREEVELDLGQPHEWHYRPGPGGRSLRWVDQLWQVDVLTDPDGHVESVACKPSDSILRRAVGWLLPLPE